MGEVNGVLIGISIATGTTWFDRRIIFRYLSNTKAIKFAEFTTTAGTGGITISQLTTSQQLFNNRLYFNLVWTVNGTVRGGIMSVGGFPGNFNIIVERSLDNDTLFTQATDNLTGFYILGDYIFQTYNTNSVTYFMPKTVDGDTFGATSIYETVINPNIPEEDAGKRKQLIAVRVTCEPLPSGGTLRMKYKVDGGSLTTIFEETTANTNVIEKKYDTNGAQFDEGTEYEFTLETTGAKVIITGLEYQYQVLDSEM
jgi:hypothetical protein